MFLLAILGGAIANSPSAIAQNAPTITSNSGFEVSEGSTAVATLTATDAEDDDLTWSLADPAGDDGALFKLSEGGDLAFIDPPDYEDPGDDDVNGVYEVTVQVSDGTDATSADLEVTVVDVASGLAGPATASHPEGKRGLRVAAYTVEDAVGWSLTGDDAGKFTIAGGHLRFVDPPDRENAGDTGADNVYDVTVNANDGTTTETVDIDVTVTDVDEPGAVTFSPLKPKLGTALTATLTDSDTVSGTTTWQWERNDGREGWQTIDDATSSSYTPTAADGDRYLRATATYTDGFGSETARAMAPHVVIAHRLSALTVSGLSGVSFDDRAFYPTFDADTLHYAARCTASVNLTLTTEDTDTRLAVNGVQRPNGAVFTVDDLDGESDIRITLTGAEGASTTYTVHCIDREGFHKLTTVKADGATEDLMMFSRGTGYLIMMDNNGVPRWRKRIGATGAYFRVFPDETHPRARYAFMRPGGGRAVMVVLDKYFTTVDEDIQILDPFNNTDGHDQMILPNGDYVLEAYSRGRRDLSFLNTAFPDLRNDNGDPLGTYEDVRDSVIQIRDAAGTASFNWNGWDHMAIEDCILGAGFNDEWGHINSLGLVDGDIIAGFRHCSKILRIDPDTGNVVWRAGPSILSREQWEAGETLQPNRGPAPLDFVNDPRGGFSGQHGGHMTAAGDLLVYDNASHCEAPPGIPEEAKGLAECQERTRAVEYAIDIPNKELVFQREFLMPETNPPRVRGGPGGHAEPLDNGDWMISWSNTSRTESPTPMPNTAMHVDAETGTAKLTMTVQNSAGVIGNPRVVTVSPVALAPRLEPLEATVVSRSEFHSGNADRPTVVVAFNRPVVDPIGTTPSITVTGATAAVAHHLEAGASAHAYAFTLTPDGDDPIRFALNADQACSTDGVCTADGRTLQTVPTEVDIPGPVTVAFGSSTYRVIEGMAVDVPLLLNRAHERGDDLAIPIEVQGGSATRLDFNTSPGVSFAPADRSATYTLAARTDRLVEGEEATILGFPATLPRGVTAAGTTTATVTVVDATDDSITLTASATEIAEGNSLELRLSAGTDISFTTDQSIDLDLAGTAQPADYSVSANGRTLSASDSVVLPAGADLARVTVSVVDDNVAESNETITVTATHDGASAGSLTLTIPASDGNLPRITTRATDGGLFVEGAPVIFTLSRTGPTTAALSVPISVAETGAMLGPSQPSTADFAVGSPTATVTVPTAGDSVVEAASEITVSILGASATHFEVGAPQAATVTVIDDDRAAFDLTLSRSATIEGATTQVGIAIANGATFAEDQEIELEVGGSSSAADYTLQEGADTLSAPYLLVLPAGASSVEASLTAVDDEDEEAAETVTISAILGGATVGRGFITIVANDGHPDTPMPPELDNATIDGSTLTLLYSKRLDDEPKPSTGDFGVRVDGVAREVTDVEMLGIEVRLTLASAVSHGERVVFDYTPGTNPLRDEPGNRAPAETGVTAAETLVSVLAAEAPEGEPVEFQVVLSHEVPTDLDLEWFLSDGSARSGVDYQARPSGTVTVAATSTSTTIEIATIEDSQPEADESFTLTLGEPAGFPFWAALDAAQAEGLIRNDDTSSGGGPSPAPDDGRDDPDDGRDDPDDGGDDPDDGGGNGSLQAALTTSAVCDDGLCRALTGARVLFRDTSTGAIRSRLWDFGDGRLSGSGSVSYAWSSPGFFEVTLTVSDGIDESTALLTFLVEAAEPAGTCVADERTRCLRDSRYAVTLDWWTADGASGSASVVHTGTNDSGMFWFFDRTNWEVLIKVLDGCALNGHFWVFGASTTDLGYVIRVTDTVTGRVKEYRNEPGLPAPAITDGNAFPEGCLR